MVVKAQKAEFGRVAAAAMAATTLMAGVSIDAHSVGMSNAFGQRGQVDEELASAGSSLANVQHHWALATILRGPTSMVPHITSMRIRGSH